MFKHTGIVRRIDDLGRIVIPKEIRRRFHIKEGDPLEIGEGEHSIQLKKYSVLDFSDETSQKILDCFSEITQLPIILCDTTTILYVSKLHKNIRYMDITTELSEYLQDESFSHSKIRLVHESDITVGEIERISLDGSVEGALIIPDGNAEITSRDRQCLKLCADIITAFAK